MTEPSVSTVGSGLVGSGFGRFAIPRRDPMPAFLYRCPNTGKIVQGFVADDPNEDVSDFEAIVCAACTALHWVSPKTGKVLGADEDRPPQLAAS